MEEITSAPESDATLPVQPVVALRTALFRAFWIVHLILGLPIFLYPFMMGRPWRPFAGSALVVTGVGVLGKAGPPMRTTGLPPAWGTNHTRFGR